MEIKVECGIETEIIPDTYRKRERDRSTDTEPRGSEQRSEGRVIIEEFEHRSQKAASEGKMPREEELPHSSC